jgi:outer membrane receptor protein involved in Fe transport
MPEFSTNLTFAWRTTEQLKLHTHLAFCSKQISEHFDIIKYAKYRKAMTRMSELYTILDTFDVIPDDLLAEYNDLKHYVNGEATGDRYLYKDIKVDPYFVVDIGASYTIGKLELNLNINNLLNNKYSLSGACTGLVPQKGRWFMFDIAYKF